MDSSKAPEAPAERWARKQIGSTKGPQRAPAGGGGEINIWYGKKTGRDEKEALQASTRCNPATDAGRTQAGEQDPFCVYFAQGRCSEGPNCSFQHRIPTEKDEKALSQAVDLFGRERFATEREDMGGIGSFSRENRTLYIGKVPAGVGGRNLQKELRDQFGVFGPLEHVRVVEGKTCAFVKYRFRANAEFAKEAMMSQSLKKSDGPLNLRWATEDPNPGAQRRTLEKDKKRAFEHMQEQGVCLKPAPFNYPMQYQLPDAPETKRHHAGYPGQRPGGPAPNSDQYYPDTDAQYAAQQRALAHQYPPAHAPAQQYGEWTMGYSPEGYPYYFNSRTQTSVWEPPPGWGGAGRAGGAGAAVVDGVVFETDPSAYEEPEDSGGGGAGAVGGGDKGGKDAGGDSGAGGLAALAAYDDSDEEEGAGGGG